MRKKWTTAEEQTLVELVGQGYDNVYIAERFGVTASAIQNKKNKLRAAGLLEKADRRGRRAKTTEKTQSTVDKEEIMTEETTHTEAIFTDIRRGDIYYIAPEGDTVGNEQRAGRPAIVVGNDTGNKYSGTVEIVYLTTKDKPPMPTHVRINSAAKPSLALCESVSTVSKERIESFYGTITEDEQRKIDRALLVSFGLNTPEPIYIEAATKPVPDERVKAERDIYKSLYMEIINRVLPAD